MLTELGSTMWFDSSRKLGGAAEHLIDGSEKHICRLTFEFKDVLAHCYCASLQRAQIHMPRHATLL